MKIYESELESNFNSHNMLLYICACAFNYMHIHIIILHIKDNILLYSNKMLKKTLMYI